MLFALADILNSIFIKSSHSNCRFLGRSCLLSLYVSARLFEATSHTSKHSMLTRCTSLQTKEVYNALTLRQCMVECVRFMQVEGLLHRVNNEPPAVAAVVATLEALGYASWAQRVINTASKPFCNAVNFFSAWSATERICLCECASVVRLPVCFVVDA